MTSVGICTMKLAVSTITSSPSANTKSGMPIVLLSRVMRMSWDAEKTAAMTSVTQKSLRKGTVRRYRL